MGFRQPGLVGTAASTRYRIHRTPWRREPGSVELLAEHGRLTSVTLDGQAGYGFPKRFVIGRALAQVTRSALARDCRNRTPFPKPPRAESWDAISNQGSITPLQGFCVRPESSSQAVGLGCRRSARWAGNCGWATNPRKWAAQSGRRHISPQRKRGKSASLVNQRCLPLLALRASVRVRAAVSTPQAGRRPGASRGRGRVAAAFGPFWSEPGGWRRRRGGLAPWRGCRRRLPGAGGSSRDRRAW